ncbi:ImmA/IrrE family metallo-endopeptidase [Terribacillus sp. JSM ZJ617]|uniref:ImmA/IrrE family metallo-endopeptidase n=1 Tax=Terribacillus sp. JSM ZJ617 TaxID=3342119 RepID=UPI0035A90D3D
MRNEATYSYSYMESNVQRIYEEMGISSPDMIDRYLIAKKLGIHLLEWEFASQAVKTRKRKLILLDEELSEIQKQADFFHELAHLLHHAGTQQNLSKSMYQYQENKAELFALHCLMPTFILIRDKLPPDENSAAFYICENYRVCDAHARKRYRMFLEKIRS